MTVKSNKLGLGLAVGVIAMAMAVTGCTNSSSDQPSVNFVDASNARKHTGGAPFNSKADAIRNALGDRLDAATEAYLGLHSILPDGSTSSMGPIGAEPGSSGSGEQQVQFLSRKDLASMQFSPVMTHRGVSLIQSSQPGSSGSGADAFSEGANTYGGWLGTNFFYVGKGVNEQQIDGRPHRTTLYLTYASGAVSGTNPGGMRGMSATWNGVMVGVDIAANTSTRGNIVQGNASISIDDLGAPDLHVAITNIVDLKTGAMRNNLTWANLSLNSGKFSVGDAGNSDGFIRGSFTGTSHQDVMGAFMRNGILGSFGATRQTAQ